MSQTWKGFKTALEVIGLNYNQVQVDLKAKRLPYRNEKNQQARISEALWNFGSKAKKIDDQQKANQEREQKAIKGVTSKAAAPKPKAFPKIAFRSSAKPIPKTSYPWATLKDIEKRRAEAQESTEQGTSTSSKTPQPKAQTRTQHEINKRKGYGLWKGKTTRTESVARTTKAPETGLTLEPRASDDPESKKSVCLKECKILVAKDGTGDAGKRECGRVCNTEGPREVCRCRNHQSSFPST